MYNYLNVSSVPITIQGIKVGPGECKEFHIAVNDPHMVLSEKPHIVEASKRTKSSLKSEKLQEPAAE